MASNQDNAEILAELQKHTRVLATREGSKGIFAGFILGLFVGVPLAGMTVDTPIFALTMWAPLVLPIVFAIVCYHANYASVVGKPAKTPPLPSTHSGRPPPIPFAEGDLRQFDH